MKNVRFARKNPSKILRIIEAPLTTRYSQREHPSPLHQLALSSNRHRPQPSSALLSHSQRFLQFSSLERAKRARNKSLNRSEEAIKSEERESMELLAHKSIERSRIEGSPYIRKAKLRESGRLLNFNSVNLGDRRRDNRDSKELLKSSGKKK
jgi:hypothetical protein